MELFKMIYFKLLEYFLSFLLFEREKNFKQNPKIYEKI